VSLVLFVAPNFVLLTANFFARQGRKEKSNKIFFAVFAIFCSSLFGCGSRPRWVLCGHLLQTAELLRLFYPRKSFQSAFVRVLFFFT